MSPEQSSHSASKKGKKTKQKSTGNTPASTGEAQIESNAPTKENPTVETSKTQKKGKSKDKARTEAKVSEGITSASASEPSPILAAPALKKTKAKAKIQGAEEPEEATLAAPVPPAALKSEKKKNKAVLVKESVSTAEKKRDVDEEVEKSASGAASLPATEKTKKKTKRIGNTSAVGETSLPPLPKSISATSKASAPSQLTKSSQASQKSKKAKAKEPSPSPLSSEVEAADEAAADASEQSGDDDDEHLHGFSTDDDDSSDEEDAMDEEAMPFDISKLPTIAKDDATIKRKLEKAKRQPTQDRGVIYIGRVPHGFYEDQMRGYFSQFGNVTRVRLSRNKKTGRSKHYGFVEFDSSSVAQIVAETMDNYLLTGSILRCKVIPKDEVHPELWVGANRKWRVVPRDRLTRVKHNKTRTEDEQARATKRLIKRQNQRKRKLAEAGIKYDFEDASYKKVKDAKA